MRNYKSKISSIESKYLLFFSYCFSVLITIIVYVTGGTNKAYPNFMYLPIAIVASAYGKKHGVIHAVISALLIGPFMPLNVESNTSQNPFNWVLRLIIYITIALTIGFFSDYYKDKKREISDSQMATIYSLVKLSESRDNNTGYHIERVSSFCKLLANELMFKPKYKTVIDEEFVDNIFKASALHDIGKVGIPDRILLKPTTLSVEEFEVMKTHTMIGSNTLLEVKKKYPGNKFLELGIVIANFHHEKWDGTGYPQGKSGESIPLPARIMAFADVYDALRSKRPYKEAYSHEKSIEIMKQDIGKHFDPEIFEVFMENEKEFEKIFDSQYVEFH